MKSQLTLLEMQQVAQIQQEIKAFIVSATMLTTKMIEEISGGRAAFLFSPEDNADTMKGKIIAIFEEKFIPGLNLNLLEQCKLKRGFYQLKISRLQNFQKENLIRNQIASLNLDMEIKNTLIKGAQSRMSSVGKFLIENYSKESDSKIVDELVKQGIEQDSIIVAEEIKNSRSDNEKITLKGHIVINGEVYADINEVKESFKK